MRISLSILLFITWFHSFSQQTNLFDSSVWMVGSGTEGIFQKEGADSENIREIGIDPYNSESVLWKIKPDDNSSYANGGWKSNPPISIDPGKTYRFSVWVKKTNSFDGRIDFGIYVYNTSNGNSSYDLLDNLNSTGMLFQGDIPSLNKWYLLVGYIHSNNYQSTNNISGIYDPATGQKSTISDIFSDFKFQANSNRISPRIYNAWNTNTMDKLYIFGAALYEVNGQEPTVQELLNPSGGGGTNNGTSLWSQSGSDINYMNGKVGIGTTTPGNYELSVNGEIRAKEVKVETANWPDYVFKKNYPLLSLEQIQNHINKKGHLPNIPSAQEIETNGLELGEMNRLLLEKIEELTLYIINQEKRIQLLEKK